MTDDDPFGRDLCADGWPWRAYLLGRLGFDEWLALQRKLVYEAGCDRTHGTVVVCEHPPGITIGREGSRLHIRPGPAEWEARGWPVRWVARGGGVLLHAPGQVACYPILPLDSLGLTPAGYVTCLQAVASALLADFGLVGIPDPDRPGVRVRGRRVVHIGVAVRDRISCFGLVVNVDPDLEPFRNVHCDGDSLPMTSLARESAYRVRVSGVRQRLLDHLAAQFGLGRVSVFHSLPGWSLPPLRHAPAYGH